MIFFEERSKLGTFNIHNISKYFAHSTNTITRRIYIISYIQRTQFFEELSKFGTLNLHNFLKICTINEIYYLEFRVLVFKCFWFLVLVF